MTLDSDIKRIGKNIRRLRRDAQLSQSDVAAGLNITQSALSHIERGESQIEIGHLLRLPAILGVRVTDLLPDSVVTDYDRARASDPLLLMIIDEWPAMNDSERHHIFDNVQFVAERRKR